VINPIRKQPLSLALVKYKWRVNYYIAISQAVRDVLVSGGVDAKKISVVYSGVEPQGPTGSRWEARRSLGIPADAKLVGTVGALAHHKGQRYLLEAAPIVLRKMPATRFILVGDGESAAFLRSLASQLGVDNAIMFPGFQPNARKYISACDVFVAPSLMEGLNTSILDAMMLHCPVIGTTVGGIPELIQDDETGLLVPPEDPQRLAEAILNVLDNPEKAGKLALAGYERAMNRFTADRMVEGTIGVYETLVRQRSGRGESA